MGDRGELQAALKPGPFEVLPGLVDVIGRPFAVRLVDPGTHRPHSRVGLDRAVEEDRPVDHGRVDGVRDRQPDVHVVERRLVDIEHQCQRDAAARHRLDPDPLVALEGRDVLVGEVGDVDLAGAQGGGADGLVADHPDRHLVEIRKLVAVRVATPVVLVPHEVHEGAGDHLLHPERPGSRRVPAVVGAERLDRGRRAHHAAPVGQHAEARAPRPGQIETHRVLVDDLDALDHRQRCARRGDGRGVQDPLDVGFHRPGIEGGAVMEDDALPQVERDRVGIRRDLPGGCERGLRPRIELRVRVDQLIEDLPPEVGVGARPAQDRVERRGLQGVAHPKMAAVARAADGGWPRLQGGRLQPIGTTLGRAADEEAQ